MRCSSELKMLDKPRTRGIPYPPEEVGLNSHEFATPRHLAESSQVKYRFQQWISVSWQSFAVKGPISNP